MPYPLFYKRVDRATRLVEKPLYHDSHYDSLIPETSYKESELEELHTSDELYNILNNWFHYLNNGDEGCDRAEGHGWYYIIYVKVDSEYIDITKHILNHFEKVKDKFEEIYNKQS